MTTTWCADLVAAHKAILTEQAVATPTLLRKVYTDRPGAFGELPCAFIGDRPETITHDAGTRTRTIAIEVWIVDSYAGDNVQEADRMDQLRDYLVDRYDLPTNVQRVPSSIIELTSVTPTEVDVVHRIPGGQDTTTYYRALVLRFEKSAKLEGRQ